jgi:hypothetical protein
VNDRPLDHVMCLHCELDNCSDCEDWIENRGHRCCCGELQMTDEDIAEERLKARDYESWANL